jgi:hypothetical protein
MYFEECSPSLGCYSILIRVLLDRECNRPSFLATVFSYARVFNGNLNQWDVAKVTTIGYSKSIYIYLRMA